MDDRERSGSAFSSPWCRFASFPWVKRPGQLCVIDLLGLDVRRLSLLPGGAKTFLARAPTTMLLHARRLRLRALTLPKGWLPCFQNFISIISLIFPQTQAEHAAVGFCTIAKCLAILSGWKPLHFTPSRNQGEIWRLLFSFGVTLGDARGTIWNTEIEPGSGTYKANVLLYQSQE